MTCKRCGQAHGNDAVEVLCGAIEPRDLHRVDDAELANLLAYTERQEPHDTTAWSIARYKAETQRRRERLTTRPFSERETISPDTIRDIKARFSPGQFVELFARLTGYDIFPRQGDTWKYRCTAHGRDSEPSGVLHGDKLTFHCFGCNSGGDLFSLLGSAPLNLTFTQAVEYAGQMVGIEIVHKPTKPWRETDGLAANPQYQDLE